MNAAFEAELEKLLATLPDAAGELARCPLVSIVPVGDPSIPPELAREIAKVASGAFSKGAPSCCSYDDETGEILIVVGRMQDLPHELIHAAQVLADDETRQASFHAVALEGQSLAQIARKALQSGTPTVEHRDLSWCKNATTPRGGHHDAERLMSNFDLHAKVHPTLATLAIGKTLGMPDRDAVNGAVFAFYAAANGYNDARDDVCREVVAYRHQNDLKPLIPLFESAVQEFQVKYSGLTP